MVIRHFIYYEVDGDIMVNCPKCDIEIDKLIHRFHETWLCDESVTIGIGKYSGQQYMHYDDYERSGLISAHDSTFVCPNCNQVVAENKDEAKSLLTAPDKAQEW